MKKKVPSSKTSLIILLIAGVCLMIAIILTTRSFTKVHHKPFPKPRETNVSLIQDWMTLSYISHTYGVPQPELYSRLSLDPSIPPKTTLSEVAKKRQEGSSEFTEEIKKEIVSFQETHQTPPTP